MSPRIDMRSILNPVSEKVQQKPSGIQRPPLPSPSFVTAPKVLYGNYNQQLVSRSNEPPYTIYGNHPHQPRYYTYPIQTQRHTRYMPYSYPQQSYYSPVPPVPPAPVSSVPPAPPVYYVHQYPPTHILPPQQYLPSQYNPCMPYNYGPAYRPGTATTGTTTTTTSSSSPPSSSLLSPLQAPLPVPMSVPIRKELEYVTWENKRSSKSWTAAEDALLRHLKEVEHKNWIQIATHFPDRTTNGCQFRWRRIAGKIRQKRNKSGNSGSESDININSNDNSNDIGNDNGNVNGNGSSSNSNNTPL